MYPRYEKGDCAKALPADRIAPMMKAASSAPSFFLSIALLLSSLSSLCFLPLTGPEPAGLTLLAVPIFHTLSMLHLLLFRRSGLARASMIFLPFLFLVPCATSAPNNNGNSRACQAKSCARSTRSAVRLGLL